LPFDQNAQKYCPSGSFSSAVSCLLLSASESGEGVKTVEENESTHTVHWTSEINEMTCTLRVEADQEGLHFDLGRAKANKIKYFTNEFKLNDVLLGFVSWRERERHR